MDEKQLLLQLGIAGALLLVGWRIAILLIANWRETEKERTKALADGFSGLIGKVDSHHTADIQSHQELSNGISEIKGRLGIEVEDRPKPRHRTNPLMPATAGYYPPSKPPREDG